MIKLKSLLSEIDKNKWTKLTQSEKQQYKDEIFNLIQNAYAYIGGHTNYKSANDVTGAEGDAEYEVIDLDRDDEIDAVSISKKHPAGIKFAATGHDGSKPAKSAVINHKADLLKKSGYYVEVSGKIKDILISKGAPIVTDPEVIQKVLVGKEIKNINSDGSYVRTIAGHDHEKIMLGHPKV
jgi:hypothetical protein